MNVFSRKSESRLSSCHSKLQVLMRAVLQVQDISIICGHRTKQTQNSYYRSGTSKLKWPDSKHNKSPSLAVDIIAYPFCGWNNLDAFKELSVIVKEKADELGIKIKWGGDFKSFVDMPHWQLEEDE